MALKNSPEMESESREKEHRRTMRVRSSKCKAEISCSVLSPHHVFADSNAIQIGGEKKILAAEKKGYRKVANRKRPISMLEIEITSTALQEMEAKVKKKREEMTLMKNNLVETRAVLEDIESMLDHLKGEVYAIKN